MRIFQIQSDKLFLKVIYTERFKVHVGRSPLGDLKVTFNKKICMIIIVGRNITQIKKLYLHFCKNLCTYLLDSDVQNDRSDIRIRLLLLHSLYNNPIEDNSRIRKRQINAIIYLTKGKYIAEAVSIADIILALLPSPAWHTGAMQPADKRSRSIDDARTAVKTLILTAHFTTSTC